MISAMILDAHVHVAAMGSDWPVISFPPPLRVGPLASVELMHEKNWMRRDGLIKQRLGFGEAYWHRAATLLRIDPLR